MISLSSPGKLTLREVIALGLLAAMMIGTKIALAALPNIHLGAVILTFTVAFFGWKALYTAAIYILLEGLVYGFGIWWISYLYCWPLLVAALMAVRKKDSPLVYSAVAAAFGFSFGALCEIPYFFLIGRKASFTMWMAGIPFDLVHGAANFALCALLFPPLQKLGKHLLPILKK